MRAATRDQSVTIPMRAFKSMLKACEELKDYEEKFPIATERMRKAEMELTILKQTSEQEIDRLKAQIETLTNIIVNSAPVSSIQAELSSLHQRIDQLSAEVLSVQ
jgi:polyhydroxyalkanoate synthesis regulator phasin